MAKYWPVDVIDNQLRWCRALKIAMNYFVKLYIYIDIRIKVFTYTEYRELIIINYKFNRISKKKSKEEENFLILNSKEKNKGLLGIK